MTNPLWISPSPQGDLGTVADAGNSQDQDQQGRGLRAQLERALNENKALKENLDKLAGEARTRGIEGLLSKKGVPAKVAALVPRDVEATEEGLGKWLEGFGDVFAKPASVEGQPAPQASSDGAGPTAVAPVDPAAAAFATQMAAMGGVQQNAMTLTQVTDLMTMMKDPSLTKEKLDALVNAAGGGYGVG